MGFGVASAPPGNTGYNRVSDWPSAGGSADIKTNNGGVMGLKSTIQPGTSNWHPTVSWMLGFVVVELVAFHVLSRALNI